MQKTIEKYLTLGSCALYNLAPYGVWEIVGNKSLQTCTFAWEKGDEN